MSYRNCCEVHVGEKDAGVHTHFTHRELTMNTSLHSPYHWITVALVASAAMLTLSDAHGQRTDAGAMFQGRPAMAGAQAGTGPMAGPPQGGIGIQGQDNAGVALRAPKGLRDMPQGTVDPAADSIALNRAVKNDRDVVPKDSSFAPEQRSSVKKVKRVAKNTRQQSRTGVATIQ
jgi:hypothetical protein